VKATTGDTVVQVFPRFAVDWIHPVHGSVTPITAAKTVAPDFFVLVLLPSSAAQTPGDVLELVGMRKTSACLRLQLGESAALVAVPEPFARLMADVQVTVVDPPACTQPRALCPGPSPTRPVLASATFAEATAHAVLPVTDRSTNAVHLWPGLLLSTEAKTCAGVVLETRAEKSVTSHRACDAWGPRRKTLGVAAASAGIAPVNARAAPAAAAAMATAASLRLMRTRGPFDRTDFSEGNVSPHLAGG
jgi:hypothetical protein